MSEAFDPYREWLQIPDGARPPDHHAPFGLTLLEPDPVRIKEVFFGRQELLQRYEVGACEEEALRLLHELSAAHSCPQPAAAATVPVPHRTWPWNSRVEARVNLIQWQILGIIEVSETVFRC